jgi:hypothetical protein
MCKVEWWVFLSVVAAMACRSADTPEGASVAQHITDGSAEAATSVLSSESDDDAAFVDASAPAKADANCKASPPAAPDGCRAAGHYLRCSRGDVMQLCLSDNSMRCVGLDDPFGNCQDLCDKDEYALSCGGVGPNAPSFSAPQSCRGFGRAPGGGLEFLCCPCADTQ